MGTARMVWLLTGFIMCFVGGLSLGSDLLLGNTTFS